MDLPKGEPSTIGAGCPRNKKPEKFKIININVIQQEVINRDAPAVVVRMLRSLPTVRPFPLQRLGNTYGGNII